MAAMSSRQQSEFVAAVVRHLPCDRISSDEAQRLIGQPTEIAALLERAFLAQESAPPPRPFIERRFALTFDYSVAPADALRATGCDYIYPWMKLHCPPWKGTGIVEVEACLIDMGQDYETAEAEAAIAELGVEKAPDNLAIWTLSCVHPDLQREVGVMDPGCVWRGKRGCPCIACLGGHQDFRSAGLSHVAYGWSRRYRVLALSKKRS
ncbi:MAG: hypothetical protein AAB932_05855 [Patescibacteria group bacterium]